MSLFTNRAADGNEASAPDSPKCGCQPIHSQECPFGDARSSSYRHFYAHELPALTNDGAVAGDESTPLGRQPEPPAGAGTRDYTADLHSDLQKEEYRLKYLSACAKEGQEALRVGIRNVVAALGRTAGEPEQTRVRDLLQEAFDYFMGPHACGDFTCNCNKPEVCGVCDIRIRTQAALAAPVPRKAYRCWFNCPKCKQEHETQWETWEKPDFSCQRDAAPVKPSTGERKA